MHARFSGFVVWSGHCCPLIASTPKAAGKSARLNISLGIERYVSCAATMPCFTLMFGFAGELQALQRRTVLWVLGRVSLNIRA